MIKAGSLKQFVWTTMALFFAIVLGSRAFAQSPPSGTVQSKTDSAGIASSPSKENSSVQGAAEDPSSETRIALLEQTAQTLKEHIGLLRAELDRRSLDYEKKLADQQKSQDTNDRKIESLWTVWLGQTISAWMALFLAIGGIGIFVWMYKFFIPNKIKMLIEQGKEGLAQIIIEKIFGQDQVRLSKFFEHQLQENNRRILARDKRIHLMTKDSPLADVDAQELKRLQQFLDALGFCVNAPTVDGAELIIVVGKDACLSRSQELAQQLKGKLVPVILYFGPGRLDPDPTPNFELAIISNSLPTTLMHLHNMAMLPISQSASVMASR